MMRYNYFFKPKQKVPRKTTRKRTGFLLLRCFCAVVVHYREKINIYRGESRDRLHQLCSEAQIHSPWLGDKVDYGISDCRTGPSTLQGWRAGTSTLCHSRLYHPVRDYEFGYRSYLCVMSEFLSRLVCYVGAKHWQKYHPWYWFHEVWSMNKLRMTYGWWQAWQYLRFSSKYIHPRLCAYCALCAGCLHGDGILEQHF
jgi:hypothetical protein